MNARAAKRLYDGKLAAQDLAKYVADRTLDGFLGEEMWRYAVERKAGVLASAVASSVREAPELANRLPYAERVIGLQECLSLDAGNEELRRIWFIVTQEVPKLLVSIDAELDRFGFPDESAERDPSRELRPIASITENRDQIAALCREFQVERLDIFGSATTGTFNSDTSDIDFLVAYLPDVKPKFSRILELESRLADVLGRKIDLVEDRAFENPYFRQSVRMSRIRIFPL